MNISLLELKKGELLHAVMGAALQLSSDARSELKGANVDLTITINGYEVDPVVLCSRLDRVVKDGRVMRGDTLMEVFLGKPEESVDPTTHATIRFVDLRQGNEAAARLKMLLDTAVTSLGEVQRFAGASAEGLGETLRGRMAYGIGRLGDAVALLAAPEDEADPATF